LQIINRWIEELEVESKELKKGLSLASVYTNPVPIWNTSAFAGFFGDCYMKVAAAGRVSETFPIDYVVLNSAINKMVKQKILINASCGIDQNALKGLSSALEIMNDSVAIFKQFATILTTKSENGLMEYLQKVTKIIFSLNKESKEKNAILLPLLIEKTPVMLYVERESERFFTFVVIQTNPSGGLGNHAVSSTVSPPVIKYRTCLVLSDVPKKNALDNVFWAAVYNLAVRSHDGDMNRFYDILLPFLTGKPLEDSLVVAEKYASVGVAAPPGSFGDWRLPQRSEANSVKCTLEVCLTALLLFTI
jgi:hypothetical protein